MRKPLVKWVISLVEGNAATEQKLLASPATDPQTIKANEHLRRLVALRARLAAKYDV